jgi:hypothetical protein
MRTRTGFIAFLLAGCVNVNVTVGPPESRVADGGGGDAGAGDAGPADGLASDGGFRDAGPGASRLPLGAECRADGECESGSCLSLFVLGTPQSACVKLCCSESDCPLSDGAGHGFGCIEYFGASFCLTDRIFSGAGVTFARAAGEPCSDGAVGDCRSGTCETDGQGNRTCVSSCCRDSDCGSVTCAFRPPFSEGEVTHHLCENAEGYGALGAACQGPLDCASYICLPLGASPFCTRTCCTAADCPADWNCIQVDLGPPGASNVGSACVPRGGGTLPAGATCTTTSYPNECASDLCAQGVCRVPCCADADCPAGEVCRAIDNGEPLQGRTRNGLVRVCATP